MFLFEWGRVCIDLLDLHRFPPKIRSLENMMCDSIEWGVEFELAPS